MDFNKKKINYLVGSSLIFFITFMSFREHFVIYGDAIQQLSTGRDFPIPEWGIWIPARVIGDFFANVLFQSFYILVAPIFDKEHIAEVYAIFNAILFSLIYVSFSLVSFQYSKLFININEKYFFVYALVFYVLYMSKGGLGNLTLLMAYDVPIMMGLWFVYPFITYITNKEDPLKSLGDVNSIILISIFGYLVSFSTTNVEVFVVLILSLCTLSLFLENIFTRTGQEHVSLRRLFLNTPKWFIFGIVYTTLITGIAFIYDMNGGRYGAEKNYYLEKTDYEGVGLVKSFTDLNLGYDTPLIYFLLIAVFLLIYRIVVSFKKHNKKTLTNYINRISAIVIIFLSLVFYFIFLIKLTEFGSRNYFVDGDFSSFFHFFISLMVITSLFFFNKNIISSIILSISILVISLHGIKQITNPPINKNISINEAKNIFNSMYMSYCFGSDRVPVFLRKPVYPYVPIPDVHRRDWFGKSYSRVFSQSVIKDYSVHYFPVFSSVSSVNELHSELNRFREKGRNICLDISDSPYYIQLGT